VNILTHVGKVSQFGEVDTFFVLPLRLPVKLENLGFAGPRLDLPWIGHYRASYRYGVFEAGITPALLYMLPLPGCPSLFMTDSPETVLTGSVIGYWPLGGA